MGVIKHVYITNSRLKVVQVICFACGIILSENSMKVNRGAVSINKQLYLLGDSRW